MGADPVYCRRYTSPDRDRESRGTAVYFCFNYYDENL
jgi:hypothetical protein